MKFSKLIICLAVLSMIIMVPVLAKGPSGQSGKSNMGHLYLVEKDPDTWDPVVDGRWGKMNYTIENDTLDLVMNAHGYDAYYDDGEDPELPDAIDDPEDPDPTSFTLIYYPDLWEGNGLICLGSGVVEREAVMVLLVPEDPESELVFDHWCYNVHIKNKGELDIGDLPTLTDENYPDGAKIWLVLSADVDCGNEDVMDNHMIGWNPGAYLFEEALIVYDDPTDPPPAP